jgi:HSP20 family molecular chaperone IbpA
MFYAPVRRNRSLSTSIPSFDSNFERFFNTLGFEAKQDDKAVTLTLDLPGVAREDLKIDVEGAVVTIATREEAKRQYKAAYELADEIDVEATTAKLENGVLTLVLAKKVPVSNARTIEIK